MPMGLTSFCLPFGGNHHVCLRPDRGDLEGRSLSNLRPTSWCYRSEAPIAKMAALVARQALAFALVVLPRSLHKDLEMAGDGVYQPAPGLARTPGHVGCEQQVRHGHQPG